LPLGDPQKTSATHTKDFGENIGPNSPNLEEKLSEIFRQSHRPFLQICEVGRLASTHKRTQPNLAIGER